MRQHKRSAGGGNLADRCINRENAGERFVSHRFIGPADAIDPPMTQYGDPVRRQYRQIQIVKDGNDQHTAAPRAA